MRIMLSGAAFPARLSTRSGAMGQPEHILLVDRGIALSPEDVAATGCVLAEATAEEREALERAGFGILTGDSVDSQFKSDDACA